MLYPIAPLIIALQRFCGSTAPPVAPPEEECREWPSTSKTPLENFRLGRLVHRFKTVDEDGNWWKIETRQCRSTGVIMRHTVRITD